MGTGRKQRDIYRTERLAARRQELKDIEREELIEKIEDSTSYKVGYWIGMVLVIGLSPIIVIVIVFFAFAGGAPLFVLDFLANGDQWKPKRGRY